MTTAALQAELTNEGDSFMAKYVDAFGKDSFGADIARVFNRDTGLDWPVERVMKAFAVMHGYLHNAYIDGWWEEGDPEWSESRESSWRRWVLYLQVVDGLSGEQAQKIASNVFYAVDEIAPYS